MRVSCWLFRAAILFTAFSARADVIYNMTLTSTAGFPGGTGYFALNIPPPSTGTVAYSFQGTSPFTPGYLIDAFVVNYTPPPNGYGVGPSFGTLYTYIPGCRRRDDALRFHLRPSFGLAVRQTSG